MSFASVVSYRQPFEERAWGGATLHRVRIPPPLDQAEKKRPCHHFQAAWPSRIMRIHPTQPDVFSRPLCFASPRHRGLAFARHPNDVSGTGHLENVYILYHRGSVKSIKSVSTFVFLTFSGVLAHALADLFRRAGPPPDPVSDTLKITILITFFTHRLRAGVMAGNTLDTPFARAGR